MQDINPFEQCCIDDNLGPLIEHIVQYKISIDKICDIQNDTALIKTLSAVRTELHIEQLDVFFWVLNSCRWGHDISELLLLDNLAARDNCAFVVIFDQTTLHNIERYKLMITPGKSRINFLPYKRLKELTPTSFLLTSKTIYLDGLFNERYPRVAPPVPYLTPLKFSLILSKEFSHPSLHFNSLKKGGYEKVLRKFYESGEKIDESISLNGFQITPEYLNNKATLNLFFNALESNKILIACNIRGRESDQDRNTTKRSLYLLVHFLHKTFSDNFIFILYGQSRVVKLAYSFLLNNDFPQHCLLDTSCLTVEEIQTLIKNPQPFEINDTGSTKSRVGLEPLTITIERLILKYVDYFFVPDSGSFILPYMMKKNIFIYDSTALLPPLNNAIYLPRGMMNQSTKSLVSIKSFYDLNKRGVPLVQIDHNTPSQISSAVSIIEKSMLANSSTIKYAGLNYNSEFSFRLSNEELFRQESKLARLPSLSDSFLIESDGVIIKCC